MKPTDDGRCSECGAILTEVEYVRSECFTCGAMLDDVLEHKPESPLKMRPGL